MISQVDRGYLRAMQRYAKVLQQRNSLLKQVRERQASSYDLNFWDQELAHAGGTIMHARAEALGRIALFGEEQMVNLSDGQEHLDVTYAPALGKAELLSVPIEDSEWTGRMLAVMQETRSREIGAGVTLVGPHRDDVTIEVNELPAATMASRAQQRTAALSLRLAEATYLRDALGDDPVVLLDDVLSELDARRRKGVLEYIDSFEQTIVTTADPDRVRDILPGASARFLVQAGAIMPFEGE